MITAERLLLVEDDPDWQVPLKQYVRHLFRETDLAEDLAVVRARLMEALAETDRILQALIRSLERKTQLSMG